MTPTKVFVDKIPAVIWTPAKPTKRWVMALHGLGEIGDGSDKDLQEKLIDNKNFANLLANCERLGWYVVMPQVVLKLNGWENIHKPEHINKVADYALKTYGLDPNYMYLTGLSMGGGSVWYYLASSLANASRVAAAIPICGTFTQPGDYSLIGKARVPVWAFHAKDDKNVNYMATQWHVDDVNKFAPAITPKITLMSTGGHGVWSAVYNMPELYTWLAAQGRTGVQPAPPRTVTGIDYATKLLKFSDNTSETIISVTTTGGKTYDL